MIAGIAWLTALALALRILPESSALNISDLVFPVVGIGAGLLMALGARQRSGASRVAWLLFGLGVVALGMGEAVWGWYEVVLGVEPPFPGLPDVLYLSAYPLLIAGILVNPRMAPDAYQRGNQIIDTLVAVSGLAILAWMTILAPAFKSAGDVSIFDVLGGLGLSLG